MRNLLKDNEKPIGFMTHKTETPGVIAFVRGNNLQFTYDINAITDSNGNHDIIWFDKHNWNEAEILEIIRQMERNKVLKAEYSD